MNLNAAPASASIPTDAVTESSTVLTAAMRSIAVSP